MIAQGEAKGFYHTPRVLFQLDTSIIKAYNQGCAESTFLSTQILLKYKFNFESE